MCKGEVQMSKKRWLDDHVATDLALVRERDRIRSLGARGNDIAPVRQPGERTPGELADLAAGCIEGARSLLDTQRRQMIDGRRKPKKPRHVAK